MVNKPKFDTFVTYQDKNDPPRFVGQRIGHVDLQTNKITALDFASGAPITSIYQVIEYGISDIIAAATGPPMIGPEFPSITILPPLPDRDVLAVGKNYVEHAKEFNASGYDASDRTDLPSHPVIFTKRATSIIAHEEPILLHRNFTQTLDYEGEIGVIIGKAGTKVRKEDADEYVWGYTIINDVSARERQRDHKQFYIGKSGDSYCPMGPFAVHKDALPKNLTVTTHVNGEKRQEGNLDELIFSIPTLIETLSASQTLRPGDVIATGTPFEVGFGLQPPVFLQPGDIVEISVTGLGTLRNTVIEAELDSRITDKIRRETYIPTLNREHYYGGLGLTSLHPGGKELYAKVTGNGRKLLVFIHGFGASHASFSALARHLGLNNANKPYYTTVMVDLEGCGLSPTKASSNVSVSTYASDVARVLRDLRLTTERTTSLTIIAHSTGAQIAYSLVADHLGLSHPRVEFNMILLNPHLASSGPHYVSRALKARTSGMAPIVETYLKDTLSSHAIEYEALGYAAAEISFLACHPEGYAKACEAMIRLDDTHDMRLADIANKIGRICIVTGRDDRFATPEKASKLMAIFSGGRREPVTSQLVILEKVGHLSILEDPESVARAIEDFL